MAGDDQSQHVNMRHHHETQGAEEDGDRVSEQRVGVSLYIINPAAVLLEAGARGGWPTLDEYCLYSINILFHLI